MYRSEWKNKTKLQVINDSIVSAGNGYKAIYLFGIRIYYKKFEEDFENVDDEPKTTETIGFTKSKKK